MKNTMSKGLDESKVFIENEQSVLAFNENHVSLLEKTVFTCLQYENIAVGCEMNILITDDASIKQINNQFRNINRPTDVLSFPMVNMKNGIIFSEEGDYDRDEELLLLGDIVISMETAQRQAGQYGHALERELAFLASHGVFHLLGYDHMDKDEEAVMLAKQEAVLDKLGLKRV